MMPLAFPLQPPAISQKRSVELTSDGRLLVSYSFTPASNEGRYVSFIS
jgi:hypothetical protein